MYISILVQELFDDCKMKHKPIEEGFNALREYLRTYIHLSNELGYSPDTLVAIEEFARHRAVKYIMG